MDESDDRSPLPQGGEVRDAVLDVDDNIRAATVTSECEWRTEILGVVAADADARIPVVARCTAMEESDVMASGAQACCELIYHDLGTSRLRMFRVSPGEDDDVHLSCAYSAVMESIGAGTGSPQRPASPSIRLRRVRIRIGTRSTAVRTESRMGRIAE